MYDKIYVNGASWVQGHGVEKEEVFSYHLSKLIGCEELNVAEGGASNDWVIRETIDYVLENDPKNHLFVFPQVEVQECKRDLHHYIKCQKLIRC